METQPTYPAQPKPKPTSTESAAPRKQLPFALVGFYLSCAGVALGATVGSAGFLWFESRGALVFGIVMVVVCAITCYRSLVGLRR